MSDNDFSSPSSNATVAKDVSSTAPAPLQDFHYFPKLPQETRDQIWTLVCSHQRYVAIYLHHYARAWSDTGADLAIIDHETGRYHPSVYVSGTPVPSILHASREARSVALKKYTLTFGKSENFRIVDRAVSSPMEVQVRAERTIYINWEHDILCTMGQLVYGGFFFHQKLVPRGAQIAIDVMDFSGALADGVEGYASKPSWVTEMVMNMGQLILYTTRLWPRDTVKLLKSTPTWNEQLDNLPEACEILESLRLLQSSCEKLRRAVNKGFPKNCPTCRLLPDRMRLENDCPAHALVGPMIRTVVFSHTPWGVRYSNGHR